MQLEGCKELMKEGVEMLGGRLDVVVNNAGITHFMSSCAPSKWVADVLCHAQMPIFRLRRDQLCRAMI